MCPHACAPPAQRPRLGVGPRQHLHPFVPILLLYLEFHPAFLNGNTRALNTQCHGALSGAAPACAPPRSHSSSTAHPTDLLARVRRRPEQQHEDARQARPEVLDEHLRVVGRVVVSERKRSRRIFSEWICCEADARWCEAIMRPDPTTHRVLGGGRRRDAEDLRRGRQSHPHAPLVYISSAVLHTRR